jgi:hypothetical protein
MIPLAEINHAADKFKVPPETIEKDYVICWVLRCLSMSGLKDDFIFYGGTAIKRMYFEEHRYFEDIDLISAKTFKPDLLVSELDVPFKKAKENANLVMSVNPARILSSGTRTQILVEYSGYDEILGAPKEVRLDFVMDMDLYGDTTTGKSFESYSDLKGKSGVLSVMTLNTILAGKLGLLMDTNRKEPRDIFDIWFLLNRLDQFDFDLGRMREAFKQKNGFFPLLATLRPHLGNPSYKKRWEERLMKQIAELPPFDRVIQDIQHCLEDLLGGRDSANG